MIKVCMCLEAKEPKLKGACTLNLGPIGVLHFSTQALTIDTKIISDPLNEDCAPISGHILPSNTKVKDLFPTLKTGRKTSSLLATKSRSVL